VGWLLSTAYLSKDILPKIDSMYKSGIKDFILMGHSQGGAINFLLTAHLYSQNRVICILPIIMKALHEIGLLMW